MVPITWGGRSFSAPSAARISKVHRGPLVSTSELEKGVDRCRPQVTMPTCAVWPSRPAAAKRGRSRRLGSDLRSRPR